MKSPADTYRANRTKSEIPVRPGAGQLAYERDLQIQSRYHDGSFRPSWQKLNAIARWSWERNPTSRSVA